MVRQLRPCLIGITCGSDTLVDRHGVSVIRHVLAATYAQAVAKAGGLPVLLSPQAPETAEALVSRLDGVVFSGGDFDVPPSYYGQETEPLCGRQDLARSGFERALLHVALARKVPVLGVCGGMQLLNVVCGGTLFQDRSLRPETLAHEQNHDARQPDHDVAIVAGSRLAKILSLATAKVNSTHHQMLDRVAEGLVVSARAPDGVVEGIELTGNPFALGVQWHPERLTANDQLGIYRALVEAASSRV